MRVKREVYMVQDGASYSAARTKNICNAHKSTMGSE
jgi:hypothetical protein